MIQNSVSHNQALHQSIGAHQAHQELARRYSDNTPSARKANKSTASIGSFTFFLHASSTLGFIAMLTLTCMFFSPDLANKFSELSPFSGDLQNSTNEKRSAPSLSLLMATPELISQATVSEEDKKNEVEATTNYQLIGNQRQQLLVTHWLSKRYRVANDAIDMLVSAAYLTAKETKLDPLLILSVIAIESRFNPFSESPVGAQGLMQVMSKVHEEKFSELGGVKAALNPVANIKVGATILKDYVRSSGSIEGGLKRYVGAADSETDGGYGMLVMAEYKRLKEVAAGKPVSIFSTTAKPTLLARPQESTTEKHIDEVTHNHRSDKFTVEQVAGL